MMAARSTATFTPLTEKETMFWLFLGHGAAAEKRATV